VPMVKQWPLMSSSTYAAGKEILNFLQFFACTIRAKAFNTQ
jgi:hypothetical protein